MRVQNKKSSIS